MSNIIPFAESWHAQHPQGISVSAECAWRHLNIMRDSDIQKFAQALHMECPITSYFVSQMPVGHVHSMEYGRNIQYSRASVRDSIKIARSLKMIKIVSKDLNGVTVQLTTYGFMIRNSLRKGLFTKTG